MIQLIWKLNNSLLCILGSSGSWSVGSWITARFIQSLILGVINVWHLQKMCISFTSTSIFWKKWTIDQLFKNNRICKQVINFKNAPRTFCVVIINLCFLTHIILFPFVLWQITSWNVLQSVTDWKKKQGKSET